MGIPYSKQINFAFGQVTPLVAAGFRVLETTKNISILLAVIQVLTVLVLGLILVSLVALLITVNPDLEEERRTIISPTVKWLASWLMHYGSWLRLAVWTLLVGSVIGGVAGWLVPRDIAAAVSGEEDSQANSDDAASGDGQE